LYDHQHLHEQFQDSQFCSSIRPQQSSLHQRLNQVTETAIGIDPQHHNILLPESSTPFRYVPEFSSFIFVFVFCFYWVSSLKKKKKKNSYSLQTIQTHGLLNQTGRQSIPYLSSGTNALQTQILNLQTERVSPPPFFFLSWRRYWINFLLLLLLLAHYNLLDRKLGVERTEWQSLI
jgi:hypothetical protein